LKGRAPAIAFKKKKDKVKHDCIKTLYINKDWEEPSHKCRETVQKSDMACICRNISIEEELKISMGKLVRLTRECGKTIPGGSECGQYQVLLPLCEINCHVLLKVALFEINCHVFVK
jgi:hypothetical protein